MKKTFIIMLSAAIILMSCIGSDEVLYIKSGDYDFLSSNVIRLHILADGDDDISQEIKMDVRDAVLREFSGDLGKYSSKDEAEKSVTALLGKIEGFVNNYLKKRDVPYGCTASVGKSIFPDRTYSSIYFPAGEYTALKLTLGSGQGRNWWCVMYPPLCFAQVYDDEEIPDDTVEVRWKIAEWWDELWQQHR